MKKILGGLCLLLIIIGPANAKKITHGADTTQKGIPLYLLDGKKSSKAEIQKISPDSIESVNVLKGKEAKKLYGRAGANGVVAIKLKKEVPVDPSELDVMPSFPGGDKAWTTYLIHHLKYPPEARMKRITGRVLVGFVIDKTGEVTDVSLLRGIGKGCDEEAMRIIRESPNWTPGVKGGKAVRVRYTLPITFSIVK